MSYRRLILVYLVNVYNELLTTLNLIGLNILQEVQAIISNIITH